MSRHSFIVRLLTAAGLTTCSPTLAPATPSKDKTTVPLAIEVITIDGGNSWNPLEKGRQ